MSFIGSGTVTAAFRKQGANAPDAQGFFPLGNCTMAKVNTTPGNKVTVREGASGLERKIDEINRQFDQRIEIDLTAHNRQNLALLYFGTSTPVVAGIVTNEVVLAPALGNSSFLSKTLISSIISVTSGDRPLGAFTIAGAGDGYTSAPTVTIAGGGTATATLTGDEVTAIVADDPTLTYATAPAVTLTGGGFVTPNTATVVLAGTTGDKVLGTDYSFDRWGAITPLAGGSIVPYQQLLVTYNAGAVDSIDFLTGVQQEIWIKIKGKNDFRKGALELFDFYKVVLEPNPEWMAISMGQTTGNVLKLSGELQYVDGVGIGNVRQLPEV